MQRPRSRSLTTDTDYHARLVYYPPVTEQRAHRHARTQLSFLLSGCFDELSEGRTHQPLGRQAGVMPAGHVHSVRFGREGALMLSIECPDESGPRAERRSWQQIGGDTLRRLHLLVGGSDQAGDLAADIVDAFNQDGGSEPASLSAAPAWLRLAVGQIAHAPDTPIAELAREAGVHRVHFSRQFYRYTGLSPTEFRLLRKAAGGMRRTIDGEATLAQAAIDAGFADQAHWTRTCRTLAGIPPGKVRRLFGA